MYFFSCLVMPSFCLNICTTSSQLLFFKLRLVYSSEDISQIAGLLSISAINLSVSNAILNFSLIVRYKRDARLASQLAAEWANEIVVLYTHEFTWKRLRDARSVAAPPKQGQLVVRAGNAAATERHNHTAPHWRRRQAVPREIEFGSL